jgi:hypothetical protein
MGFKTAAVWRGSDIEPLGQKLGGAKVILVVSSGQSAVFYDGDAVIGGGIIQKEK